LEPGSVFPSPAGEPGRGPFILIPGYFQPPVRRDGCRVGVDLLTDAAEPA
jgi:hypothetical protein